MYNSEHLICYNIVSKRTMCRETTEKQKKNV